GDFMVMIREVRRKFPTNSQTTSRNCLTNTRQRKKSHNGARRTEFGSGRADDGWHDALRSAVSRQPVPGHDGRLWSADSWASPNRRRNRVRWERSEELDRCPTWFETSRWKSAWDYPRRYQRTNPQRGARPIQMPMLLNHKLDVHNAKTRLKALHNVSPLRWPVFVRDES